MARLGDLDSFFLCILDVEYPSFKYLSIIRMAF